MQYEDSLCGGCGHDINQAWSTDALGEYVAESMLCHACALKEATQKREGFMPGTKINVRLSSGRDGAFERWDGSASMLTAGGDEDDE